MQTNKRARFLVLDGGRGAILGSLSCTAGNNIKNKDGGHFTEQQDRQGLLFTSWGFGVNTSLILEKQEIRNEQKVAIKLDLIKAFFYFPEG